MEQGICNRINYSEYRNRKNYTTLKERPGFDSYLYIDNFKLCHAINKLRISAHKFPTETGRYDRKNKLERICSLSCEDIGDGIHLDDFKNEKMKNVQFEPLQNTCYLLFTIQLLNILQCQLQ